MNVNQYQIFFEKAGIIFETGLSFHEVAQIEEKYEFKFPKDYLELLMTGLPISDGFINWRTATESKIIKKLSWPLQGICFDIENNDFWLHEWGQRPELLIDRFTIAKKAIEKAPKLIPIYGHRYIPDRPAEIDNPIFSVYQTDIIYYGRNLNEYLENEFGKNIFGQSRFQITEPIRIIPFWSKLVC